MALASFFDGDGEQESNSDMEVIDDQPESQQPSAAMSKGRPQSNAVLTPAAENSGQAYDFTKSSPPTPLII